MNKKYSSRFPYPENLFYDVRRKMSQLKHKHTVPDKLNSEDGAFVIRTLEEKLTPREAHIIGLRYVEQKDRGEIATIYCTTPYHITRIEGKAISKLAHAVLRNYES